MELLSWEKLYYFMIYIHDCVTSGCDYSKCAARREGTDVCRQAVHYLDS